jgi:uncharacterized protein (DUF2062 family)
MRSGQRLSKRWLKYVPTRESILAYRFLKPVRHFLDHHRLWQFNRGTVAAGAAVGLFFSVATPVAQVPIAAIVAILLKVNLPVAVLGTLLSNPLTTPAILFFAFKLGAILVGHDAPVKELATGIPMQMPAGGHFDTAFGWLLHSFEWIQSAGMPLIVGLGVLSVLFSVLGYVGVIAGWRIQAALRWHTRCNERRRRSMT